ncbi:FtsX-like permease family protein [Streptomyces kaniharaensis]|uniref:FtsX-like permease family protein n=1 Tax=Streptomyces kaniharaensis TaxID=212423 RepID=A0A6N7L128_9ACTN|nr:FtsX-like permease family protein [Streptomyces kaniharaensis]MQS15503.1 FtsX-like permease family protein [Streptomyces kaniharaensis]
MVKASIRNFLAHKGRMALSTLAVLLGVAFVSGTLVFSDTINVAFTNIAGSTAADVTVKPKQAFTPEVEDRGLSGEVPTMPAAVVAKVAAVPGVQAAHGQISLQNLTVVDRNDKPVGATTGAPTLGQNWYDDPQVHLAEGHAPTKAGEIVIDQASARHKNLHLGDPLHILTPTGSMPGTVVGIVTFTTGNPGVTMVYTDTATAQTQLLGKPDQFTGVTVDTAPGTGHATAQQRIKAALGDGYSVATKEQQAETAAQQISSFLSVVTLALLGFAGLAVLVGIFLILNTFSMLVAQRTRELGLLRALGAGRGQVLRAVLTEALLLGVIGSTLGLGAGIGLAAGLKSLISGFGVDLSGTALVINPLTPVAAYAVGVVVTLVAAYLPARRAARISPMAALREATTPPAPKLGRRTALGSVLLAAGSGLLYGAATHHATIVMAGGLLGGGILLSLVALAVLGPALSRVVVYGLGAPYPAVFGAVGRMSRLNAVRNPRRTGATAGALMISLSLVGAVAVLAASLTTSVDRDVDNTFGADYVLSGNGATPIGHEVTDKLRAVPGIQAVTRQRYAVAHLNGFQLVMSGVDTATVDQAVKPQYVAGSTADVAAGKVMVDETTANADRLTIGSPVELHFLNGNVGTLTVGAISKPPAGAGKDGGSWEISLDTLNKYAPEAQDFTLYLDTAAGADKQRVQTALDSALAPYPQVTVQSQADYKKQITGQVGTVLHLVYALLALAIVIAVLGVVNTLALSVIERTREIGLLRAIGTSRGQVGRLIRLESVLIAVHGALLGLGLGLAWGVAGQRVLVLYGITALSIPWTTILAVLAGSAVAGLAAAVLPAVKAARMRVLGAIAAS